MLKALTKNLFERALKEEMDEHLGYSKYGRAGRKLVRRA